jgi:hypothetical protein
MADSTFTLQHTELEPERPPWYQRAFRLFAFEHFDSDNAAMLARSEWQEQRRLDAIEPERPILVDNP